MSIQHTSLASGKWKGLTLIEQLSNVGSEVYRASSWKNKGNKEYSLLAADRALELLDFSLSDLKNKNRYKEIARLRETLVDYFYGDNFYKQTKENLENYFYSFNYAARL